MKKNSGGKRSKSNQGVPHEQATQRHRPGTEVRDRADGFRPTERRQAGARGRQGRRNFFAARDAGNRIANQLVPHPGGRGRLNQYDLDHAADPRIPRTIVTPPDGRCPKCGGLCEREYVYGDYQLAENRCLLCGNHF